MGVQDNRSIRDNQNNSGSTEDILSSSGDILISNRVGTVTALPIGLENQQLVVDNGQASWQNSSGEAFRTSYCLESGNPYFNATWGENGVPYDQESLTRYSNSWNVRANYLEINNTTGVIDEITSGVGAFTTDNLTLIKQNTQNVWATCYSPNITNMNLLLNNLGTTGAVAITTMTSFVTDNVLSGIDINFVDYDNWTAGIVTNMNTWLGSLKTSLNNAGAQLNISLPAIGNATMAALYNFDYSTFISNVDRITIKMFNANVVYGRYMVNCPIEMITGGRWSDTNMGDFNGPVQFYDKGVLGKFNSDVGNNMQKLIISLPNFGYVHTIGAGDTTFSTSILARNKLALNGTFATDESAGTRDFQSQELYWEDGTYRYRMNDEISLQHKVDACRIFLDKWELDNPGLNAPRREIVVFMGGNMPTIPRP